MSNETEMQEPHGTERMSEVARQAGETLTGTSLNPADHTLGDERNDVLIDPLPEDQGRQPRPDQTTPGEPLGAPVDPAEEDPSRVQGDPAEDQM